MKDTSTREALYSRAIIALKWLMNNPEVKAELEIFLDIDAAWKVAVQEQDALIAQTNEMYPGNINTFEVQRTLLSWNERD